MKSRISITRLAVAVELVAIAATLTLVSSPAVAGFAQRDCEAALVRAGITTMINRPNTECVRKPAA